MVPTLPGETDFLPEELIQKCYLVVQLTHRKRGFDSLTRRVVRKTNMVMVGAVPAILRTATIAHAKFKVRVWCWLGVAGMILLAWALTWWLLLALIPVLIAEQQARKTEHNAWMLVAAALLGIEVLAMDLAGWGGAYPNERKLASHLIDERPLGERITWLRYYFPQQGSVNPSAFEPFAPEEIRRARSQS